MEKVYEESAQLADADSVDDGDTLPDELTIGELEKLLDEVDADDGGELDTYKELLVAIVMQARRMASSGRDYTGEEAAHLILALYSASGLDFLVQSADAALEIVDDEDDVDADEETISEDESEDEGEDDSEDGSEG